MYYLTEAGDTAYLPASWTDAGLKDPFVAQSNGRAIARVEDLLELARMIEEAVKTITPET